MIFVTDSDPIHGAWDHLRKNVNDPSEWVLDHTEEGGGLHGRTRYYFRTTDEPELRQS